MSSIRKDVARVVRLKEFHSRVEQLLPPADRDYFFYALKEYKTYKSVAKLMLALNSCLDTPEKLDLLPSIRELIPRHDRRKFDNLAPYNRMAHPPSSHPVPGPPPGGTREEGGGKREGGTRSAEGVRVGTVRNVFMLREKGQGLGLSIRGGREHDIGIFISQVDPFSLSERSGLVAGDKILSVNGFSFESITHDSAVLILKSHKQLQLTVATVGQIPGQPRERKSLIWVDTSGNPVNDETTAELSTSMEKDQRGGDRLLESPDKHKVVLTVGKEQPLGFSIRGGREFSLGIFISQVEGGSPAEESGLKSGDQILGVNGHSFISILHQEAVAVLRAYTTLVLTVRSLGRLPQLVNEEREEVDGATPTSPAQPPHPQPVAGEEGNSHSHTHKIQSRHTHSDAHLRPKRWSDWQKSVSQRSQSVRDFFRPKSLYASPPHHRHHPPRSHSHHHHHKHQQQQVGLGPSRESLAVPHYRLRTSSDGALTHPHHHNKRHLPTHQSPLSVPRTTAASRQTTTSPLALHGTSPLPPNTPKTDRTKPPKLPTHQDEKQEDREVEGGGEDGGSSFFRYGVGTQLMLATVSSSARALLEDSARRCLNEEEMEALTHRLQEYERNGGVESFAEFLVSLLDTPTKMQLLSDIRSVLAPSDLLTFDSIVSPHEIAALQKRMLLGNRETMPTILTTPPPPSSSDEARQTKVTTSTAPAIRERQRSPLEARLTGRGGEREGAGRGREGEVGAHFTGGAAERVGREEPPRSTGSGGEGKVGGEERANGGNVMTVPEVGVYTPERGVVGGNIENSGGGGEGEEEEEEEEEGVREDRGEEEERRLEEIAEEEEEEEEEEEDTHEGEGGGGEEEEGELEPVTVQGNYNLVLYEIQSHGGQGSLRRAEVGQEGDMGTPHIGAFASEPASDLLSRASEEEPSMVGMQTRESFMEWNEDYDVDSLERRCRRNVGHPVIVEIVKSAPQLGLTITGGVDTPSPGVIITDVKEGGAAGIDGFLQPGFEIVQADGVRIRGLTHDAAAQTLARAFRSERPTIELIVIPSS